MNQQLKSLRHSIRIFKNEIIERYFRLRINATRNPTQVLLKKGSYKVIFILGHMRSGSSLLTHILVSNPAIKGYGETHIQYQSEADLKKLISKIYCHSQEFKNIQDLAKLRMNHTYVLDKLLHDNKLLNENLLRSENFYFIFLLREPKRSLMSMLDQKPHWTEKDAERYYTQRLSTLQRYAKIINNKSRSLLLTHDQLIHKTNLVFETLQSFLNTSVEFSEKYQVLWTTGMRDVGDFKENIRSGRIIRQPRKLEISISPNLLEEKKHNFNQSYEILSQWCQTIDDIKSG